MQSGIILSGAETGNLDSSFSDTTKVNPVLINGDTVVLDGWGRPLIIQVDIANNSIAKLVSAGAGTGLGFNEAIIDTPITTATPATGYRQPNSDDRILYLNAPTPANDVNPPCNGN